MFTCLNSLRDVEPTVNLLLDDSPMETRPDIPPEDEEIDNE
jgi:hypothetical protein